MSPVASNGGGKPGMRVHAPATKRAAWGNARRYKTAGWHVLFMLIHCMIMSDVSISEVSALQDQIRGFILDMSPACPDYEDETCLNLDDVNTWDMMTTWVKQSMVRLGKSRTTESLSTSRKRNI